MSDAAAAPRSPMTIGQQAEFLDYLISRTIGRRGDVAVETTMLLTAEEVETLSGIAARLHRIAPHEKAVRRMVSER
ncbi:hypothetical protein ACQR1I_35825 [Bradyrhizobium sp. HKCCYLS2038]|uniref:hypothetical protein n=1 Tax=Bradyrhizobium sp. HKCCYLS2038 TaxID=3420764 RepID=UPI003EBEA9B7